MDTSISDLTQTIAEESALVTETISEISKVIIGQKALIQRLVIAILTNGHVLVEGVPGLAKTLAVKTLAASVATSFMRIQFTPDLLPADILGTRIYRPESGQFEVKKGPIFSNIILADEINRAPAKVQSAMLEAMQERQVTIGETTFILEDPFLVMATQNPIEQEGTYPLPEAQVDRLMFKVKMDYPGKAEEAEIVKKMAVGRVPSVRPVLNPDMIKTMRRHVQQVYLDDKLLHYIVDLVSITRHPSDYGLDINNLIHYGASPRAGIFLALAARGCAYMEGRAFVTPQDIKTMAPDVFRHRIILSYEAEAEEMTPDDVIARILETVEVP
ncbi:MAG: MoxR family ATPase [Deltaproteobacteria bacterium]|nr:MoxR family ATPase [Deltaproteobacteria bacterium]